MTIWMRVSKDDYELPEVIALSAAELARLTGVQPCTIYTCMRSARQHGGRSQYVRVDIDETDETDESAQNRPKNAS